MRYSWIQTAVVGVVCSVIWVQPATKGADTLWSVEWQKPPQNPVLSGGSWGGPCVIYDDSTYKMWFAGDAGGASIMYSTSANGTAWTSPVTVLSNESFATWEPWVIKDGSTYRMWYRVHNGSGSPGDSWINYATSTDGTNWTRHGTVMQHGSSGSPDYRGATRPVVFKDGSTYRMWYAASSGVAGQAKVGYATSSDGMAWTKQGTVFGGDGSGFDAGDTSPLGIYKEGEYYYLLYGGWNGSNGQLGLARSQNGTSGWERKTDPIISAGGSGAFDSAGLGYYNAASIVKVDHNYLLWYPGRASSGPYAGRTSIGLATSGTGPVPANAAPTITSSPVTVATAGALYSYDVDATDSDGDALTYSLTTAPAGMTINASTGLLQWTPSGAQVGSHDVTVQVSDGHGGTASQSFAVPVAAAPIRPVMPIPALRDCVRKIRIGTAVNLDNSIFPSVEGDAPLWSEDPSYRAIVKSQFNMLTPENAGKWGAVLPEVHDVEDYQNENYRTLDKLCDFANLNGLDVKGHTLVWHSQCPNGLAELTSADKISLLENHIVRMVDHFKGKIKYWDVVNEAFDDDGNLRDSRDVNQPNGEVAWADVYGNGNYYIRRAFNLAHSADPGAVLIYNDYGIAYDPIPVLACGESKARSAYELIRELLSANPALSGKLGVGFQCHFYMHRNGSDYVVNLSTSPDDVRPISIDAIISNLMRFSRLDNCKLQLFISEFDVAIPCEHRDDPQAYLQQALFYRDFAYAVAMVPNVRAIQTWGFTDKYQWQRTDWAAPLLWDRTYKAYRSLAEGNKLAMWYYWLGLLTASDNLVVQTTCPVDIVLDDPEGRRISKQSNQIDNATYVETDTDGDEDSDDCVVVPMPITGEYRILVARELEADPQAKVTLSVFNKKNQTILLSQVPVADLPAEPLVVRVDRDAPSLAVHGAPAFLAPPSGQMAPVSIQVDCSDNDPSTRTYLMDVRSSWDEDVDYVQGADLGTDDREFLLRASLGDDPYVDKTYTITYGVADSTGNIASASVTVTVLAPVLGDCDGDRNVDRDDLNLVLAARNQPGSGPNDPRDLDHDGMITALDARKLVVIMQSQP